MSEQEAAYSRMANLLDTIAQEGSSPEHDERLVATAREIKQLKDRLLALGQPEDDEMSAFLTTELSDRYLESVRKVDRKYQELKKSGQGDEALHRAFEIIGNAH